MIYFIIIMYFINVISVILHEVGHFIVALIVGAKVERVCLGNKKYGIFIGKLSISPIILGGYVECTLDESKRFTMIIFYISGPIVNLLVSIGIFMFGNVSETMLGMMFVNFIYFIVGMCPFIPQSDISLLRKVWKKYSV